MLNKILQLFLPNFRVDFESAAKIDDEQASCILPSSVHKLEVNRRWNTREEIEIAFSRLTPKDYTHIHSYADMPTYADVPTYGDVLAVWPTYVEDCARANANLISDLMREFDARPPLSGMAPKDWDVEPSREIKALPVRSKDSSRDWKPS